MTLNSGSAMTHPLSHLAPADRHQAEFDDAVRIAIIQRDRWIDYPRAAQARERLNRLLATPQRERMPCMVLYGESNIGKTLIIRRFMRDHPNAFDAAAGVERIPVLVMQMPPTPEQHRFYAALLFELGAPFAPTARLSVLEGLARGLLRRVAPRLLVVDEGHHLLAGSYREQRASLNLLKYLANDLRMCIVLVGTRDAPIALQSDPQMSSRFVPVELPRWRENEELRGWIKGFERILPLRRPSGLDARDVVQFVMAASHGITGEISRLLNAAAELAILDQSERISMSHLQHVAAHRT